MEILNLIYDAHGPGIHATCDAVASDGVRVLGHAYPNPSTTITLEDLATLGATMGDPEIASDLAKIIARLDPLVREQAARDASDPGKVRMQAAQNARDRVAIEAERRSAAEAVSKAHQDRTEHEHAAAKAAADKAAAQSEIADLDSQLEARRAALRELDEKKTEKTEAAGRTG